MNSFIDILLFYGRTRARGGAGVEPPAGLLRGFLFVATKRNPSDSKEKNAFGLGSLGTRGIVVTKQVGISGCYP